MMEETTPRNSSKWVPHQTFAEEVGKTGMSGKLDAALVDDVERKGSIF